MYPEVELGTVFLPLLMMVVALHGPRHSIVLLLPLLLLDLYTNGQQNMMLVTLTSVKSFKLSLCLLSTSSLFVNRTQNCACLTDVTPQQQVMFAVFTEQTSEMVDRQLRQKTGRKYGRRW